MSAWSITGVLVAMAVARMSVPAAMSTMVTVATSLGALGDGAVAPRASSLSTVVSAAMPLDMAAAGSVPMSAWSITGVLVVMAVARMSVPAAMSTMVTDLPSADALDGEGGAPPSLSPMIRAHAS